MFFAQTDINDFSIGSPFRKSIAFAGESFQFIDARGCDDADRTIGIAQNALVNFTRLIFHRSAGGNKCPRCVAQPMKHQLMINRNGKRFIVDSVCRADPKLRLQIDLPNRRIHETFPRRCTAWKYCQRDRSRSAHHHLA